MKHERKSVCVVRVICIKFLLYQAGHIIISSEPGDSGREQEAELVSLDLPRSDNDGRKKVFLRVLANNTGAINLHNLCYDLTSCLI